MKRIIPFFLFCIVLVCVSCLDKQECHYTPHISFSYFVANHKDTLAVNTIDEQYVLDSAHIGDTIRCAVLFQSLGNDLQSTYIEWDSAYITNFISVSDSVQAVLTTGSTPEAGICYFKAGYNGVAFPLVLVMRKEGSSRMTFTVNSDSKFSPTSYKITFPVAAKK